MFTIDEILKATGGRLVSGPATTAVRSVSIDTRTLKRKAVFIAIKGDTYDGHDFIPAAVEKGALCIIAQGRLRRLPPGVSYIVVKDTVKALGALAGFWRRKFSVPVVAITGSNGKTTTKDMAAWVLAGRMRVLKNEGTKNNHIGVPMTLFNLRAGHDVVVLELGTNHPGEIRYLADICRPNIGIVANVGAAHLEFFGSVSGVLKEKYSLIRRLSPPALALVNADDERLRQKLLRKTKKPLVLGFGISHRSDFFASRIIRRDRGLSFVLNHRQECTLRSAGVHNVYNALAACALGRFFGMDWTRIASRLRSFRFPSGRLGILKRDNIRFIDDTYNANPQSLYCALQALESLQTRGRKILVVGDMLELGAGAKEFHSRAGAFAAGVCDCLVAVGTLSKFCASAARSAGMDRRNIFLCATSRAAKGLLRAKVGAGGDDIVLVKGSRAMKMEEVLK